MFSAKMSNKIIQLKKAINANPELTHQQIAEQSGVSISTVNRVFKDGSEEQSFRYESIKALAEFLLPEGMDETMDDDEIEMQIALIKEKYEQKLENEREQHRKTVEFLMSQIELKDTRITQLLNAVELKDAQYHTLYEKYLNINAHLHATKDMLNKVIENRKGV